MHGGRMPADAASKGITAHPYHPGELEVQQRAGVEEDARRVGRIVSDRIPPAARDLLSDQRMAIAGSLDPAGRVWASLLLGQRGFVRAIDDRLLHLDVAPPPRDPLAANLRSRGDLAILVIDLLTRRRMRFNGKGMLDPERGIFLLVDQAYGNCRKYIQARLPEAGESSSLPSGSQRRFHELTARHATWISQADTFFIASFHPEGGADASHRGGRPGFVRVLDSRTLVFPDYPGNNMFNTLGNIIAYPPAGLLFVDFARGDILQMTGRAALLWEREVVAAHRGARDVVVAFEVDRVIETPGGGGMRWQFVEYSPVNP